MDNITKKTETRKLPEVIIPKVYPQLLQLRNSKNANLQPNDLVRETVKFRYYQVIGIMHLLMMTRMVLGDGTGLGKCVVGDTLITTDRGLVPIKAFCPESPTEDTSYPVKGYVVNQGVLHPIKSFYYSGIRPTRKIETNCGYSIEGSLVHPILVVNKNGDQIFKRLSDLQIGDKVCISTDDKFFPTENPEIRSLNRTHGVPETLTPELAAILGYLISKGTITNNQIVFTHPCEKTRNDYIKLHDQVFGILPKEESDRVLTNSELVCRFLVGAGLTTNIKNTPWVIFQGTKECAKFYLSAIFEVAGRSTEDYIEVTGASEQLIREIQILLLRFGIKCQLHLREAYWGVNIAGDDVRKFHKEVGFFSSRNTSKENIELEDVRGNYFYDSIATITEGKKEVMDLEIDDPSHTFVGNGFQNHNTITTIGTYSYLLEKDKNLKLLIIAPKSATSQWVDEFAKFTNGISCQRLENFGKSSRIKQYEDFWTDPTRNVLVMHYHFFREDFRLYEPYLTRDFVLVMDEITAVKSYTSKTHKVACIVSEKAKRCYGLTATLLKNNLLEGYGIYRVVFPNIFGTITKFKTHFCVEKKQEIGGLRDRKIPVVVGYKNVDHFRKMIDPFFLGRNKYDVSTELPELISKEVECHMSDRQWDYYTQALGDSLTIPNLEGELVEKEMSPLTRLGYFQQIVNHPEMIGLEGESEKERELYRILNEDLIGEKVIIFSKYKKMVDIIQRELGVQNIESVRITGDEDEDQRTLNKLIFQEDQEAILRWLKANCGPEADVRTKNRVLKSCKTQLRLIKEKRFPNIILLTPAGTEALNLQAAGAFIFYDIPWSPGDYDQLLGRMIRIGSQHKTVLAIHMMCKGTIDDYVLQTVLRKSKVIKKVLGEQTKGALQFEQESDSITDLLNRLRQDAETLRTKGKGAFLKDLKDE